MANESDMKKFLAEFETLKAKYGEAFADLKVVRFTLKRTLEGAMGGATIQGWQDFVPYWCTADDEGFITCEDEREI